MKKVTLPYLAVIQEHANVSAVRADELLREAMSLSETTPHYLEVRDARRQQQLYFRDGQIYSASRMENGHVIETPIKDFLVALNSAKDGAVALYSINNKLLHSLLIVSQKKASLKVLTSLVDVDELLDKIEEERKSCVVSATQESFFAILRYEKGRVTALGHELSSTSPREKSFREDFLVQIYTLSAENPLTITVYEELLVKYAPDAQKIDAQYNGPIVDLFLHKPPTVTLRFKGKDLGHWVLDRPVLNIGRTEDNDIAIDNLAVSRLHAVLEQDQGQYYIRDCDSLNGTSLNGNRVGRARLNHGDVITIGKHEIFYSARSGRDIPIAKETATFDQTVIIGPGQKPPQGPAPVDGPRLIAKGPEGDQVIRLDKDSIVLGKDDSADVELDGMLIAKQHAEITSENGHYRIRHLSGFRKVSVGGRAVKDQVLKNNDEIRIGKREFIFQD